MTLVNSCCIIAGKGWFQNLKAHHSTLRIASNKTSEDVRNIQFSEKDWMQERTKFIENGSGRKVLPTKRHIFILELDKVNDVRHPTTAFDVLVISVITTFSKHPIDYPEYFLIP